jgi:hypothetical protein
MMSRKMWLIALVGVCGALHPAGAHAEKGRTMMLLPGAPCEIGVTLPEAAKGRLKSLYPRGTMLTSAVNSKKRKTGEAEFHVRAAQLGPALASFLCTAGGQVTLPDSALSGRSPGVDGRLSSRQALELLLNGTGLSIADENEEGFVLKN